MSLKPKRMYISLIVPEDWREKIVRRVRQRGHVSIADYVRDLIREDLERGGLLGDDHGQG